MAADEEPRISLRKDFHCRHFPGMSGEAEACLWSSYVQDRRVPFFLFPLEGAVCEAGFLLTKVLQSEWGHSCESP